MLPSLHKFIFFFSLPYCSHLLWKIEWSISFLKPNRDRKSSCVYVCVCVYSIIWVICLQGTLDSFIVLYIPLNAGRRIEKEFFFWIERKTLTNDFLSREIFVYVILKLWLWLTWWLIFHCGIIRYLNLLKKSVRHMWYFTILLSFTADQS